MRFRAAKEDDIPEMALIRSKEWGSKEYWVERMQGYINKTLNPQKALLPRIIFLAIFNEKIVGFIAGHLTTRFDCDGELEWINVIEEFRNKRIASQMIHILAKWFVEQNAYKICIDPGDDAVRKFYFSLGAEELNKHWLWWKDISMLL